MLLLLLFSSFATVFASISEDLALYDLVEEVNENFYTVFQIEKDSSLSAIKKAYRQLSLQWHPDRNDAPEATEKFRQVVGIYEILKSTELREKYDNVLEFGLPDWRQPIYYYRKARKLSWYETLFILLFICTIGHYLMGWASYFEHYLVLNQNKKKTKGRKGASEEADRLMWEELEEHRPRATALLPILLVQWAIVFAKHCFQHSVDALSKEEPQEEVEPEAPKPRRVNVPQPVYEFEIAKDIKAVSSTAAPAKASDEPTNEEIKQAGAPWNLEELSLLVRLTTEKYPPGTPNRWTQMARVLQRTEDDVTVMAGKLKQMKQEEYVKLIRGQQSQSVREEEPKEGPSKSQKADDWTQQEQQQFENALRKYPKGTDERWERISEHVGTKSKEQCSARFKHLAEMVRQRKTAATGN